jgi:type IV secretory pathway VirB10-like protein
VVTGGSGYVVNDLSTNGVFVNGEKAASGQTLSRADVIRVGTEEFRFHADVVALAPTIEFSAISQRIQEDGEQTDAPPLPFPVLPSLRRPDPPPAPRRSETPRRSESMRRTAETRRPESVQIGRRPAATSATPSRLARAAATAERQVPTPARSSASTSAVPKPQSREGSLAWLWFALLFVLAVSAFYLLTK